MPILSDFFQEDPLFSARILSTNPEAIKECHKRFFKAGSDVVVTATYQASIDGFQKHMGITLLEAQNLIKTGVTLAREACNEVQMENPALKNLMVAGSVGPYGASLHDGSEYTGNYINNINMSELKAWHKPRIELLMEAGVDLLAVETIPSFREALVVLEIMKDIPNCQGWVTFSCKDGAHTCSGESFCDAINQVISSTCVVAAGLNCTDPAYVSDLLVSLSKQPVDKPIIVKPNSGEIWDSAHRWHGNAKNIVGYSKEWLDLGASWFGGCCRVYPEDISKLKTAISNQVC